MNSANAAEVREIPSEMFSALCGDNSLASYYVSILGAAGRYLTAFYSETTVGYEPQGPGRRQRLRRLRNLSPGRAGHNRLEVRAPRRQGGHGCAR